MSRSDYQIFRPIATRWMDNDIYGHVNNVVFYSWFDTAVNAVLIEAGLLDVATGSVIGLVVESGCRYHRPVAFPQSVEAGLRIGRLGNSSMKWEIGIFTNDTDDPAVTGFLVHVLVDRVGRRPADLPAAWRETLERFVAPDSIQG